MQSRVKLASTRPQGLRGSRRTRLNSQQPCVCVCVREREREREEREKERECVCVRVRERERKRERVRVSMCVYTTCPQRPGTPHSPELL